MAKLNDSPRRKLPKLETKIKVLEEQNNIVYDKSQKELAYIIKQQSRAVKKSVNQMHSASEVTDVNISRLTPLQIDDVRDYTDASENEMVASIPPDFTDSSNYKQRMIDESEKVKKVIGRRMTKKTVIILSAICLAVSPLYNPL